MYVGARQGHVRMAQTHSNQVRRAFLLGESSAGAGLHSRLLLGSDILTCVIAAVSASTTPHLSRSSELSLEESEDEDWQQDLTLSWSNTGVGVAALLVLHRFENSAFNGHSS